MKIVITIEVPDNSEIQFDKSQEWATPSLKQIAKSVFPNALSRKKPWVGKLSDLKALIGSKFFEAEMVSGLVLPPFIESFSRSFPTVFSKKIVNNTTFWTVTPKIYDYI